MATRKSQNRTVRGSVRAFVASRFSRQVRRGSRGASRFCFLRGEQLEARYVLTAYLPPTQFLFDPNGPLSEPMTGAPLDIALSYLSANAANLGLAAADVSAPIVTDLYTDADTGLTHVYLRQQVNGLEVDSADFNFAITASGQVLSLGGGFVPGLSAQAEAGLLDSMPTISAEEAVREAAGNLGLPSADSTSIAGDASDDCVVDGCILRAPEISLDDITAELHYVPTADGGAALAWQLVVRTPDNQHWYNLSIDAVEGDLVAQTDWVSDASYEALPIPVESPNHGSFQVVVDPHLAAINASPHGWHDTNGIAGAESTLTIGNNVDAHLDRDGNNVADVGSRPDGGPGLNFNFTFDPTLSPLENANPAVTNLFYWNNILHDVHYQYGFTSAAGNFQTNTYGLGGAGNDAVQADAQDNANGGSTNNANFGTPPDGSAPRMQMFEFANTTPRRDSDFDVGIIIHEYGHGVSNRLTGGPANADALDALQSGGMGEGWGDWWGLMLTQQTADATTEPHGTATYALGQPTSGAGFRAYRYDFNITNPSLETFLAYGTGAGQSTQVHWAGTRWASALWDLNHLLIQKYGFEPNVYNSASSAGNIRALHLVMTGLKLQPANPTFLQARDAILAADTLLHGGVNHGEIWAGFARRGLGLGAATASSGSSVLTTSFVAPGLTISGSVPSSGAVVAVAPTNFVLNFSSAVNAGTVTAADLLVNGIPADSVALSNGNQTATFAYLSTPITVPGPQTMNVAGGAVTRASDGDANDPFTSTFQFGVPALQVAGTTPASPGGILTLPAPLTLDVHFNQPINPASVQTGDLVLSGIGALVSGVVVLPGDTTARFTIINVGVQGTLNASIAAGAVTSAFGGATAAFTSSFQVDIVSAAYPTNLWAMYPLGSLVYDPSIAGVIGVAGDLDSFTLAVDAGQTIAVVVTSNSTTLRPTAELFSPTGTLLGSNTAPALDRNALLQSLPSATAGTYTVRVGGSGGSTGNYTVQVYLNAAVEGPSVGIGANNTRTTAQSLTSSFFSLSTPQATGSRGAVVGSIASTLTLNAIDSGWWSAAVGHTATNVNYLAGLSTNVEFRNFFAFDLSTVGQQIAPGGAQLRLTNPTGGYSSPDASETYSVFDVTTPLATLLAGGPANATIFSDLGSGTGYGSRNYTSTDNNTLTSIALNANGVAALNAAIGRQMALGGALTTIAGTTNQFVFGSTNSASTRQLVLTLANNDFYSFSANAGDAVTIALKHLTGSGATIQLQNSAGALLANGAPTGTLENVISNFIAPTTGTYFVQVTGTLAATYSLVVTRDAAFDTEPNETFVTAQPLDENTGALGAIHPAVVPSILSAADGNSSNSFPFHIGSSTSPVIPSMRYQQFYSRSEFSQPGTITALRFRRSGNAFNTSGINIKINLGYAGTSFAAPSSTFATNVHPDPLKTSTVLDTTNLTLSSSGTGTPNPFDIVIPIAPFFFDPSQGDLLLDIFMRNSPTTQFFDAATSSQQSTMRRVFSAASANVDAPTGTVDPIFGGIVTRFDIDTNTGEDWYSFNVANTINGLRLETSTPADGANQFVNNLNPQIELYDPTGALVASGLALPDGDNEFIQYQPLATGAYRVRVGSQNNTAGEYFLTKVNAPRVVASSLVPNAVLAPGAFSFQATFSESMKVTNLSSGDFTLRGNFREVNYAVNTFSFDPSGTILTLNYLNLPDDNYTLTLISGVSGGANFTNPAGDPLDGEFASVFPSGNGAGGGNFVIGFSVDLGTEAYPTPLGPKLPPGSLIYDPSLVRTIAFAGDGDSFTLAVDPGQTISVVVTPATGALVPTVELRDPSDILLASAAAATAGQAALLNTAAASTGGTYRIDVSSAAGTGGRYTVQVILNAALEVEARGGASNDSLALAQDLNATALELGDTASRLAVVGNLGVPLKTLPGSVDFETGLLPSSITTFSSNAFGRIEVAPPQGTGNASAFALLMDSTTPGNNALNEAIYTVDLTGVTQATLRFSHIIYTDESTLLPIDFAGHFDGDGVSISDDGVNWRTILNAPTNSTWTTANIDLVAAAAAAGMTLGPNFQIKFQQFDNFPINVPVPGSSDGRGYDDIRILVPDREDYYSFTLAAGESATVALTGLAAGALNLELRDSSDAGLAVGASGAANLTQVISNFAATATGTYFARVTGGSNVPYSLLVTRNAAFDTEPNSTFATAQDVSQTRGVLGHVTGGATGSLFDLSGPVVSGPIILSGSEITLGFNTDGSFVTAFGGTGIQFDGVEFVVPGSPVASFTVGYNGLTFTNNEASGVSQITGIVRQDLSLDDLKGLRIVGIAGGTVQVERVVVFNQNDDFVTIATRLTNLSGASLANVATLENIDPDQDFNTFGDFSTLNDVVLGGQFVRASGPTSNLTVGLGSADSRSVVSAEGFSNTNPFEIINSPIDPNGANGDIAIVQSFNFGSLDVGGHVSGIAIMAFGTTAAAADTVFSNNSSGTIVGNEDWFVIEVESMSNALRLETITPADGIGEFVNTLNPKIELYNPSGALVASGVALGDLRNEFIQHLPAITGGYRVRVIGEGATRGEYFLSQNFLPVVSVNSPTFNENETATISGTITDPDGLDTHTVVIKWEEGDETTIHLSAGELTFSASRQYLDDDPTGAASDDYSILITVADNHGAVGTASTSVTVNNLAPTITGLASSHPDATAPSVDGHVSVSGVFSDVGLLDTHSVMIDWGDGSPAAAAVVDQVARTFTASHDFADGGIFPITVTAIDDDTGASLPATTTAAVEGAGLVGGVLYVIGAEGNDAGQIELNAGLGTAEVKLALNLLGTARHVERTYNLAEVGRIVGILNGGFDAFHIHEIAGSSGLSLTSVPSIPAVVSGGSGSDVIATGSGADHIDSGEGWDLVSTGDGDDEVTDSGGNNAIFTGGGNDRVTTGGGNDAIVTGEGDDTVTDAGGWNVITTDGGNDTVTSGLGNDSITTGTGNDQVTDAGGWNVITTDGGNDSIQGGSGIDLIFAGSGDDYAYGGGGDDSVSGGDGNDILLGGEGNDYLKGDDGSDLLIGGVGSDRIVGSDDDDLLIAGTTDFDNERAALVAILAEWTASALRSYSVRVANLTNGVGSAERNNGSYFLTAQTVHDDNQADQLTGSGARDWFFANVSLTDDDATQKDKITDLKSGEVVEDIDY